MGKLAWGKVDQFGNVYVRTRAKVENVSFSVPHVERLDFYKLVRLNRIMVRNTSNATSGNYSIVELFSRDPSLPGLEEWHRVYVSERFDSSRRLDDRLTHILYAVDDSVSDHIWLKITPSNGTSNDYTILIDGTKMVD